MKKTSLFLVILLTITTLFNSFKSTGQNLNTDTTEFEVLIQYLEENGNYINSDAPSIILAPEIKENLKNEKYLVIDIRSADWFTYGHIKNAVNVQGPELLNYFENTIDPSTFDKITVVCYSGQSAAYYASLLRLYGFNNVYSLKWGMSSWAAEFATTIWDKNSKDQFTEQLETTPNLIPEKGNAPTISTGNTDAKEILKARIKEAFEKPYKDYIVKAETAFETPSDYFIINYVNNEQYGNSGHIKGAINYVPKSSLSTQTDLLTLPVDKKILVNCDTGFASAYVIAYLQILGYDSYNLAYGANSYMNSTLVKNDWNGWSSKEIKNYPVVE